MEWNDVRHFLALARTGSVRAAGASLGVSHSTVLRRVEALEETLGARLFDRSREGFTLTSAGRGIIAGAERVEAEMASIERGVVGLDAQLEGPITITCSDDWVADLVLGELQPFFASHPGIELHMGVDGRPFDLSKREADVAIRALAADKQPPQGLIGTRLAPLHMGVYVAVAHAERLDPDRPGSEARWAAFDDPELHRQYASITRYSAVEAWGGFSSLAALVSALKRGYGMGMLPSYVGDAEPALMRLCSPELLHLGDLWLVSHPDLRSNARLRACRRAIIEGFERHAARFDGTGRSTHPSVPHSHRASGDAAS
ncbi:MAG: LysR family transcriptional regulator [Myxococcota bacterium]